jgi:acetyl-CoA C-acetyltransferase
MEPLYILSAKRTPIGNLQGTLSSLTAPELGAQAIKAAITAANISSNDIQEVLMGCVLPAGIGQAPARQSAIYGGIPDSVPATTINKMCGSGMKAIILAHDMIKAGSCRIALAGGMESMSNAPYLLNKARAGYRLGHSQLYDHMFLDGLEDAYEKGTLMGVFAEQCAEQFDLSREIQDEFAKTSLMRAKNATQQGYFAKEITPITFTLRQATQTIDKDENPDKANVEKIPSLKPAFKNNGTVTAANSSSISDGAAAVILANSDYVKQHHCQPIAKIIAHSTFAHAPAWFTTAPIDAIKQVLLKANWSIDEVDLFEINEAFAVVTLAAMKVLNLSHEKVNIYGGACALGHPIGATGARIIATLINALQQTGGRRGIASLCLGGGEATAIAIELCDDKGI